MNIILAENNTAKKSSDTSVSKTNEATINNPILGGEEREELGTIWGRPFNLGFGLDSEQSFAGQSGSNQSNQLSGSIAVTVVQELGRGNLLVQGRKVDPTKSRQRIYPNSRCNPQGGYHQ